MKQKVERKDIPLDMTGYSDPEEALAEAQSYADKFVKIARRSMDEENINHLFGRVQMFLLSALARALGLHDAIAREIRERNPHAVFPLLRTYVELSGILGYVQLHPDYIDNLSRHPKEGGSRVSFEKIWSAVSSKHPGIKRVYAELSEFGHFGSTGVWVSWVPLDDVGGVRWNMGPGWRDEKRDPLLAAAQLSEIDHVIHDEAVAILEKMILPSVRAWNAQGLTRGKLAEVERQAEDQQA